MTVHKLDDASVELLKELSRQVTAIDEKTSDSQAALSAIASKVEALDRQITALTSKVSDIDAAHRSILRVAAMRAQPGTAPYLSPTGNSFSERESDYSPSSIFAQ